MDDGSKPGYAEIVQASTKVFDYAEILSLLPGGIHSVKNEGNRTSLPLHTYGKHTNFTGRYPYDPEANVEEPFILDIQE